MDRKAAFYRRGAEDAEKGGAKKPKSLCVPRKNLSASAVISDFRPTLLRPALFDRGKDVGHYFRARLCAEVAFAVDADADLVFGEVAGADD